MIPEMTVQLYSVRQQLEADYEGTIRAIAEMGFGNVEPAGFPGSTAAEAAKIYASFGLKAPTGHSALPVGEDKNRVIEEAQMLGHKYIITGGPPGFMDAYENADTVKAMTDHYCEGAAAAEEHGLLVGYHNHDRDLQDVEGKLGYHYFLESTPDTVLYEADLYWVARAGLDPAAFVQEIGARGKVLHYKDGNYGGEDNVFLPAGTGEVDLLAASKVADHVEYAAVELDRYDGDMMQAVQESYTYLTSAGIGQGTK